MADYVSRVKGGDSVVSVNPGNQRTFVNTQCHVVLVSWCICSWGHSLLFPHWPFADVCVSVSVSILVPRLGVGMTAQPSLGTGEIMQSA